MLSRFAAISTILAALLSVQIQGAQAKPNVVFIITDDQGYGDLACTGNPVIKTPHLDALHAESARLTDYHVSPTCSPTRGALMSGHSANRAGTWHTINGRSLLKEGELTLGQIFADNGYRTGLFGKWHLGDNYPFRPEDRGFHETVRHGGGGIGQTPDYWDNAYFDGTYFHNGIPKQYKGFCTDVFFQEAQRFIGECDAKKQPFFAYISCNAPHSPFHCPEKYWKPYVEAGVPKKEAVFLGMITNIDEQVGKLRKWLAEQNLDQNTLFIFTTDNGTAAGDGIYNAGMKGKKTSPYDGGHRVPFFLHWPEGNLNRGNDLPQLTAHIDVLPTLIDICNFDVPEDYEFEGESFFPLLKNPKAQWPSRTIITDSQRVRTPVKWKGSAVMTETWRLINGIELYNITNDPGQEIDLAQTHPETVQQLRSEYDDWWRDLQPHFEDYARIRLGNEAANPSHLTSHDWINDNRGIPWHQGLIRQPYFTTGFWAVHVETPGAYEIELRRWPEELDRPIVSSIPASSPVPGLSSFRESPGEGIPITAAGFSIGDVSGEKPVRPKDKSIRFIAKLEPGDHELRCYFRQDSAELKNRKIGAYYVTIEKR